MKIKILNFIISLFEKITRTRKQKNKKSDPKNEQAEKGNNIYPLW